MDKYFIWEIHTYGGPRPRAFRCPHYNEHIEAVGRKDYVFTLEEMLQLPLSETIQKRLKSGMIL